MQTRASLVTRIRRRAANLITPRKVASGDFYPQQATCQIDGLSHLLELFLGRREDGTFVEVGAYDGITYSNTWGLAVRGWHGLMAEPVPAYATRARQTHAHHPNVQVVQTAVGAQVGTLELLPSGPFSSANPHLNQELETKPWATKILGGQPITVPVTTLTKLIAARLPGVQVDVLVVDVEGFEKEVFAGYDWALPPKMMIIELSETHPDLRTTRVPDASLMRDICRRGYEVAYKDSINTVFVRDDVWEAALITQ